MEGNIATTYTLIYRFLKQQSQHKAAEAVKKAAKAIVVLRDDVEQKGPPLEDIIREWKTKENTKSGNAASSSEDSDSADDSSSDSEDSSSSDSSSEDTSGSESDGDDTSDGDDSSDDSDDSDEATTAKKLPPKIPESDTSATLSSAGENAKQAIQIPEKLTKDTDKAVKDKNRSTESASSDPDSSDSDSSSKASASDSSDVESSSSGSGASSSSDSSDEDKASANVKAPPNGTKTTEDKGPSTSELGSESEDESDLEPQRNLETRAAKKRKTLESGVAVTTAVATGSQEITRVSQRNGKPPAKVKARFQRVKVQNLASDLLLNNGYEARGGATNDYGERAHRDLIVTRGAGFRKEKNKKKRGSYRGGEITMESHSIRFDF